MSRIQYNARTFKRELLKIFDRSYIDLYQFGPKRLTVDILGNRILIVSDHARLPGLRALDKSNRFITRMADVALLDEHKQYFFQLLSEQFPGLEISSILNDYDPVSEVAAMVILIKGDLVFASD